MSFGGAWRFGSVAGIPVRIHWSFGLLLIGIALPALIDPLAGPLEAAYGLALMAALLGCVVLHELGHGLVARRLGVGVRDITLLPFGGMARLEMPPGRTTPAGEVSIALAGPAVNGALALALLALDWVVSGAATAGPAALLREWGRLSPAGFVTALWLGNGLLAMLNLLPVAPLDGWRALRAALGFRRRG
jgi:Zn-dependent protease